MVMVDRMRWWWRWWWWWWGGRGSSAPTSWPPGGCPGAASWPPTQVPGASVPVATGRVTTQPEPGGSSSTVLPGGPRHHLVVAHFLVLHLGCVVPEEPPGGGAGEAGVVRHRGGPQLPDCWRAANEYQVKLFWRASFLCFSHSLGLGGIVGGSVTWAVVL